MKSLSSTAWHALQLVLQITIASALAAKEHPPAHTIISATRANDLGAVKELIGSGADVNAYDADGFSALHYAVIFGKNALTKLLLAAHADANAPAGENGVAPLRLAVQYAQYECARTLLEMGATFDPRSDKGESLGWAVQSGDLRILKLLVDRGGDVSEFYEKRGSNALVTAAGQGSREIVDYLLGKGANVHAVSRISGKNALYSAAEHSHSEIMRVLISKGADVNFIGAGDTALGFAAAHGDLEMVQLLLKAGADPNAAGGAALRAADLEGYAEVAQLLINSGAKPLPGSLEDRHPANTLGSSTAASSKSKTNTLDVAVSFLLAPAPIPPPGDGRTLHKPQNRVAIVSEENTRAVGELLGAELSKRGIAMVERDEIGRILAEHKLARELEGGGYMTACRLLDAGGLVFLDNTQIGNTRLARARIVSVDAGVVLGTSLHALPIKNPSELAGSLAVQVATLLPKFTVTGQEAVAVSLLNVRASVGTEIGRKLEDTVKAVLALRLSRTPNLFILERTDLDRLAQEKSLQKNPPRFRGGNYLIEVGVDFSLSGSDEAQLRVRMRSAEASEPSDLSVNGKRDEPVQLAARAADLIVSKLVGKTAAANWDEQDEGQQFLNEARGAFACGLHAAAMAAAEASWALGVHSPELARIRTLSCVQAIETNRQNLNRDILARSKGDTIPADYFEDPLNHPNRSSESLSAEQYLRLATRALDTYREGFATKDIRDNAEQLKSWIGSGQKVLAAATQPILLISTASAQIEHASDLATLKEMLGQTADELLARVTEQFGSGSKEHVDLLCYILWDARWWFDGVTFASRIMEIFARDFPTNGVLIKAKLAEALEKACIDWGRYYRPLRPRRGWDTLSEKLEPSGHPFEHMLGLLIKVELEEAHARKQALAKAFVASYLETARVVAQDTRSLPHVRTVFDGLTERDWGGKILPLFKKDKVREDRQEFVVPVPEMETLECQYLLSLCAESSLLTPEVFQLFSQPRFAKNDEIAVRRALLSFAERHPDQQPTISEYLARLDGRVAPLEKTLPPLRVSRFWEPFSLRLVPQEDQTRFQLENWSVRWLEDKLWAYGEYGQWGDDSEPLKGFIFSIDSETLKTEAVAVPPFSARGPMATLATTPQFVLLARAREFLARYDREQKKWDFFRDIVPRGETPTVSGDSVFVICGAREESSLVRFDAKHGTSNLLVSSRRSPPLAPLDKPGLYIGAVKINSAGEVCVRAREKTATGYLTVHHAWHPVTQIWREVPASESADLFAERQIPILTDAGESWKIKQTGQPKPGEMPVLIYEAKEPPLKLEIPLECRLGAQPAAVLGDLKAMRNGTSKKLSDWVEDDTALMRPVPTPNGLVLVRRGFFVEGFWFIPKADLARYVREQSSALR